MMRALIVLFILAAGAVPRCAGGQSMLRIAAAADLKYALDSVVSVFRKINPETVIRTTYGSSGKLTEQILNGAPFDVFFSADIAYGEKIALSKFAGGKPVIYARGRIVLWSRNSKIIEQGFTVLQSPEVKKVAIANPLHAPYGRRAEEFLKTHKFYESVYPKLVFGENVAQASQFVLTGSAEAGIIALSLALSPPMRDKGKFILIDEKDHRPLTQAYVVLSQNTGGKAAEKFLDFLSKTEARAVLRHYGFITD